MSAETEVPHAPPDAARVGAHEVREDVTWLREQEMERREAAKWQARYGQDDQPYLITAARYARLAEGMERLAMLERENDTGSISDTDLLDVAHNHYAMADLRPAAYPGRIVLHIVLPAGPDYEISSDLRAVLTQAWHADEARRRGTPIATLVSRSPSAPPPLRDRGAAGGGEGHEQQGDE